MAALENFESSEVSITYSRGKYKAVNKKTGKTKYAESFYDEGFRTKWTIYSEEFQKASDQDIFDQIYLNENEPGHYFKLCLFGYSTETLRAEIERREKEGPVPVVDDRKEAIKIMLKELGLPSYETLRRRKKKELSTATA